MLSVWVPRHSPPFIFNATTWKRQLGSDKVEATTWKRQLVTLIGFRSTNQWNQPRNNLSRSNHFIVYLYTTSALPLSSLPRAFILAFPRLQGGLQGHVSSRRMPESFPKRLRCFSNFFHKTLVLKFVVYIVHHEDNRRIISAGLILKGQSSYEVNLAR